MFKITYLTLGCNSYNLVSTKLKSQQMVKVALRESAILVCLKFRQSNDNFDEWRDTVYCIVEHQLSPEQFTLHRSQN